MNRLMKSCLLCLTLLCAFVIPCAEAAADPIDDDLNKIWSTQDVPAVTGNQVFTTERRFEFALNFGFIPTDDYYNYFPLSLDVHYHFTDMWGLMLRGSLLKLHTSTTLEEFMHDHQSTIDTKLLGDEQLGDVSLMASFHPVYGKSTVETFNLTRFDWGIFAGIGVVLSQSINDNRTDRSLKAHAEGIFGTDMHIFFLEWIALRIEASLRFYHAPEQWLVPCTLSVGVSFFLPQL